MPLNTMRDLLIDQLNELHAAERHSLDVLPKLAKAAASPKLARALRDHAEESKEHLSRLNDVFEELGVRVRAPERAESMASKGLCRDCLRLAEMKEADPAVRDAALIAVAQHVEHDEIAGYGCARTWAELLGQATIASNLRKTLAEERRSDTDLTRLAESLNKRALAAAASD